MAVTAPGVVLVLRTLGLGDVLTGVPALAGLRRAYPDARIVLAAPARFAELLPLVDAVDSLWPTANLRSFAWPGPPPDLAVNLHGSGPQSIDAVVSTRPRAVLTHAHPAHPDLDGPEWTSSQHEVSRWCRMLNHYRIPASPGEVRLPRPAQRGCPSRAVLIHPGASHAARQWPAARFAQVAHQLAREHCVVITGSAAEQDLATRVAQRAHLPDEAVLAGRTGLLELAALVADAKLVVCGDTGIAHLATAFGTPSVVLFGPVSPAQWGPPKDSIHTALWAGTTGDTFADRPDPGLLRLSTDTVLEAANSMLARGLCRAEGA